jgi:glycosyltransferase involved in cell wall biosynthesis
MAAIYVVVATVGRASLTRTTIDLLANQTRAPDGVVVVSVSPEDVVAVAESPVAPEIIFADRGLCRQRNKALDLLVGRADIITFFDDDFLPSDTYLASVERLFAANADVVGITGELIADGIGGPGYSVPEGLFAIAEKAAKMDPQIRPRQALYGCNMSIRVAAADGLRFDEALPLYGWQEDIDFTFQLGRRGRLISTGQVTGVHLGTKGGRTSGKRLGYSQVANIIYLRRKGTMQPGLGQRLLAQNLLANLIRSVWPEPHVDRRGRLLGNCIALLDLIRGRVDPRRVEVL